MTKHLDDITARRFGRLVVTSRAERASDGRERWNCLCDCGKATIVARKLLFRGRGATSSCGCLRAEMLASGAPHRSHGLSGTRTHKRWRSMIDRCENPNSRFHAGYGGRGIRLCARWRGDVLAFAADVGDSPAPDASLDRIDNSRGYDCGKCPDCAARGSTANWRWATPTEQMRNTRANRLLEFRGETRCMSEWAELLGVDVDRVQARLGKGWSVEQALTIPVGKPWDSRRIVRGAP